ncbi:MAG: hypothetical protein IJ756_01020 [Paludibacteraceae bacterium]|nr:hypothetical protein [Paludibacteraceae bacterium]
MRTLKENYLAIKKCVITDYPYILDWDDKILEPIFNDVYIDVLNQHSHIINKYYSKDGQGLLMLEYINHYVELAYRYANKLWKLDLEHIAEAVYYSSRVRGSIDCFYKTEIPDYFMPIHSLGAVMDMHATYGKLFMIYNGCHIGPYNIINSGPSQWIHPTFGDGVKLLSGVHVYGNTKIGNNVIVSVNSLLINEEIPDNCIVMGSSPNIIVKKIGNNGPLSMLR